MPFGKTKDDHVDSKVMRIFERHMPEQPEVYFIRYYGEPEFMDKLHKADDDNVTSDLEAVIENRITWAWKILLRYSETTPDGIVSTAILSSESYMTVCVRLSETILYEIGYIREEHSYHPRNYPEFRVSADTWKYTRQWVRERALPELLQVQSQRNLRAITEAERLEKLRKKYL